MSVIKTLEKLPVQPLQLVGRDELLEDIHQQLSPDKVVFLYGMDGVGKRAVASAYAAEWLRGGRHVLWLTASRDDLQTLGGQVLRAYQVKAGNNARTMVANLLHQHTPLLVINGIASHEIAAQFIWEYAWGRAPVIVLHTTAADGPWEPLLVRRLDAAASLELFRQVVGTSSSSPISEDPKLPALLEDLQGHPLSIRLAALQIAHKRIGVSEFRLALPPDINDPIQRALSVIGVAFSRLDPASQGLLMAMSTSFSSGISGDLLKHLLGISALQLCQNLLGHGFLSRRDVLYYDIHSLIRGFAIQQLEANGHFPEAQNRMLNAIATFTTARAIPANERLHPPLLLEMDAILNAALHCYEMGQQGLLYQLVTALSGIDVFMNHWGYQPELDRLQQMAATARTQPAKPPSEPLEAEAARETTPSSSDTQPRKPKELEQALVNTVTTTLTTPLQNLQIALGEAKMRQDRPEMARLAMQIGQFQLEQSDIPAALDSFRQAVEWYQEIGDLGKLLHALEVAAEQYYLNNHPQQAQEYAQRGLNIARQVGNDVARCRFLGRIGDIRMAMGDSNGGAEGYKRAIKLSRLMGDSENTGILLGKLAAIYMDQHDYRAATIALSEAIALFEQAQRLDLMGRSLGNLGTALGHLGRWHEAGQRHAAALRIARRLEDVEEERFQLQNLAFVAEAEGQLRWAITYGRQALYLALLEDDEPAVAELTFDLGRLLMNDPEAIGQAVILLHRSAELNPQPEVQQLLRDAKIRLRRREQAGRHIAEVEPDLLVYAGEAYQKS
jgi:tetratricopeptide (TPR) repeat protein